LQSAAVQARCAPERCAHYPGAGKQLAGARDFGAAGRRVPIEARPISPLTPLIRIIAASPTSILASRLGPPSGLCPPTSDVQCGTNGGFQINADFQ